MHLDNISCKVNRGPRPVPLLNQLTRIFEKAPDKEQHMQLIGGGNVRDLNWE